MCDKQLMGSKIVNLWSSLVENNKSVFWPNQKGLSVLQYAKNRKSVLPVHTILEKILNKKKSREKDWYLVQ